MFKGRDVIGKPIVAYDSGKKFTVVGDLIFAQESSQLLGFLVQEANWFKSAQILLLSDVQAIGVDAVITASQDNITPVASASAIGHILTHNTILKGTHILTMNGRDLGVIVDLYFDEKTGQVEGYEVSGGLFADAYSGRSFVPALQTLNIGQDVAFVPTQTAQLMEEQVGGFKAALQGVSDRVQETAQATSDKLQDLGRLASDTAQSTAHLAGTKLQALSHTTNVSMTNAIIAPAEQKAFVIGKTATQDVMTPTGTPLVQAGQSVTEEMVEAADILGILDALYRATGGTWAEPLGDRVGQTMAGLAIEQAEGRRVRQVVRNEAGSILAAPGQIVTADVIAQAQTHHRERDLLQAVGLSAGEALQERTTSAMTSLGDRLQGTTTTANDQLQSGAQSFWHQLQDLAVDVQQRTQQAHEVRQMKGALGRPVTRVILGQQDEVILNVGELITHQAIASARQAQVLDLLLNSVYTEKPQLSLENLRAPQTGIAAL